MKPKEIRKFLHAHLGQQKKVRIQSKLPNEAVGYGYVIGLSADWVLLRAFDDFNSEGYLIVRIAHIGEIRSGPLEEFWSRMLLAEGILKPQELDFKVSIENISAMLLDLRQRGRNVIIECEDLEEPSSDFYIGQILDMDHETVRFSNFDAMGEWDEEPSEILLHEITKVQIDTPYCLLLSKYVNGPNPFPFLIEEK